MRGTLVLVEGERLPKRICLPKQLWLWWHGPELPLLAQVWHAYVGRFKLEHTFRFVKQFLNWTLPRVRHPEQADRWTWPVVLAYTQPRLARPLVADHRLPWEKPLAEGKLTLSRVRRAFPSLLGETFPCSQTYRNPVDAHLDDPEAAFLPMHLVILLLKRLLHPPFSSGADFSGSLLRLSAIPRG